MVEKTEGPKDLFGDPWTPPRDPRGRKSHRPSAQGREIVAQLTATGATEDEISLQLGLSLPTLRKYYFRELAHGRALARNELLKVLYAAGKKGNTSAAREWLRQSEKAGLEEVAYRGRPRASAEPRAAKPGLKAQRQAAASEVGEGIYAPGAPPRSTPH